MSGFLRLLKIIFQIGAATLRFESELQQIKGHVQATKEKHAGAVGALSQELDAEREKSVRFGVLEKEALALRENLDILKAELELAEAKTGDIGEMQEKIAVLPISLLVYRCCYKVLTSTRCVHQARIRLL